METYSRATETDRVRDRHKEETQQGQAQPSLFGPKGLATFPKQSAQALCSGWTHRNLFKNSLAHIHKHPHKNRVPAKHLAGLEVLPALRRCLQTSVAKQHWSEAPPSSTVCQQSQLFQLTFLQLQLLQPLPVSLRGNSSLLKSRTVFLLAVQEACTLNSQHTAYYTDLSTTPENQDGVSGQLPILLRLGANICSPNSFQQSWKGQA